MLENFFKTVFTQLGQVRILKWKFWLDKKDHANVTCTFELFGARFDLDFKYDGESLQIIGGRIAIDKLIADMWERMMRDLKLREERDQAANQQAYAYTSGLRTDEPTITTADDGLYDPTPEEQREIDEEKALEAEQDVETTHEKYYADDYFGL